MTLVEKTRLALNVGRTKRLLEQGLTCEEIAVKLKKPESSVRAWAGIIKEAEEKKNSSK